VQRRPPGRYPPAMLRRAQGQADRPLTAPRSWGGPPRRPAAAPGWVHTPPRRPPSPRPPPPPRPPSPGPPPPPPAPYKRLERTTNLSGSWTGQTGVLYLGLPLRLSSVSVAGDRQLRARVGIDAGIGLPRDLLVGGRFAPESAVVPGSPPEWAVLARYRPWAQARGHALDAGTTWSWNGAAGSLDGELSLARWVGPLRLIGAVRTMLNAFGTDSSRIALAGGAVLHPLPGRLPLALAGDVAALSDRVAGEELAWSAAVQLGVSFTPHTISVFATNTASPSIQGSSRGDGRTRFGIELSLPIPVARHVGWVLPREIAEDAVVPDPPDAASVRAEAARYLFLPKRIEIPRGSTIEWINQDDVIHTVSADDGTWQSGTIPPGGTWRARFDEPGRYLFHCGPHPFMKGEVIVR
jgi:plastocyanin